MNADLLTILANDTTLIAIGHQLDLASANSSDIADQLGIAQQQNHDLTVQVNTLTEEHTSDVATMQALSDQHTTDTTTIQTLTSSHTADQAEIQLLQGQLAVAPLTALSGVTAYTQLHKWPAKTTDNLEQLGLWIDSGGHTAQSNPTTNTTPHGVFKWTPGTDTVPARIDFAPGAGWDDIFIYERFQLPSSLPTFVIDKRTFSLNAADRAVINCVEWQQEFTWNGKVYNCGWQWNFSSKLFRYFDFTNKVWKPTGIPFVDLGATPVNIMTKHRLDAAQGTTTHLSLEINGKEFPLNVTQNATPTVHPNKYTVSLLQLDADGKGDPFGVNIHDAQALYE